LADALERLWEEPAMAARLGRAGREKVERIWNRDVNLEELARLSDVHVPGAGEAAAA
jgi:hypothetical protein